jgi:4-alpha-glucanotransferase
VAYSGTHDNDTVVGWWNSAGGDSVRTLADIEEERAFARRYLAAGSADIHWAFLRALMSSVADTVVVPMQDVLGLGSEARMNLPGRPSGNWRWRMTRQALTDELQTRLREMANTYDR